MIEVGANQELKRGGVGPWLGLVLSAIHNEFANWTFFLSSFVVSIVGMFTSAIIYYMMARLVAPGVPTVQQSGMDYGAYIITGVALNMLMSRTLNTYYLACLNGYWGARTDVYLQHPGGISAMLVGTVIESYCESCLYTLVYFLVGVGFFGVPVRVQNLPGVVLTILLAVLALTGLGLAGASTFTLLSVKSGASNPVDLVFGFAATLLSGIYFPPTVLPEWLQRIGWWLPQTHALHAARLLLSGRASLSNLLVREDLLFLLGFTAITLPIGVLLFAMGMRKAQKEGSLTRWA